MTASDQPFFQSHVEFAFLFDHMPNWDLGLAARGLVQFQVFAPETEARFVFREVIERSRAAGLPAYLGVMKRHRTDPFLLTHAVDGYSLALDYRMTRTNHQELQRLLRELADLVLEHGGKFYFAKDSILTPNDTLRVHGAEGLERFFASDPERIAPDEAAEHMLADHLGPRALKTSVKPAKYSVEITCSEVRHRRTLAQRLRGLLRNRARVERQADRKVGMPLRCVTTRRCRAYVLLISGPWPSTVWL